jgi:hypothetical protein
VGQQELPPVKRTGTVFILGAGASYGADLPEEGRPPTLDKFFRLTLKQPFARRYEFLWRYLGTIDEEAGDGVDQHTNRIFRWDGEAWMEMTPAPVKKMNFGTVFSTLGPAPR